jgi:SAM-dependent methyltransferase
MTGRALSMRRSARKRQSAGTVFGAYVQSGGEATAMTGDESGTEKRVMTDVWTSGNAYGPYVSRWSRLVAASSWTGSPFPRTGRWLHVGCGTGALTTAILERCSPSEVLAVDPSKAYAVWAAGHVDDPGARFEVADGTHLPVDVADVVVSGLVLNFVPDPVAALGAMKRAAPACTVAAYVSDYAGKMQLTSGISWRQRWNSIPLPWIATRGTGSRSVVLIASRRSGATSASLSGRPCHRCCDALPATSTTTGSRSWGATGPHRATPPRSTSTGAGNSAI